MIKILVYLTIILALSTTVLSETDLYEQNQNQDDINPVYDDQQESPEKDQDKRTIFSPSYPSYGLARHTGLGSNGKKVLLGYSTVNLKLVPVVKPLHHGYHYSRPKFHIPRPLLVKPSVQLHSHGWKPVARPVIKPILPVNVPPPPLHVSKPTVHLPVHEPKPIFSLPRPTEQVNHVHHVKPVHVPVPVAVHQPLPIRPAVPFRPVEVKPVVPVAVANPVVPVVQPTLFHHTHLTPAALAPAAIAPAAPLLPAFKPSPPLFEVTRPELGVLPLGASFNSPVLPAKPAVVQPLVPHVHQQLIPQAVSPVVHQHLLPQPLPQPLLPQPLPQPLLPQPLPQPLLPQPLPQPAVPQYPAGTVIEYHGTYNPVAINGHIPTNLLPALPGVPTIPTAPGLPVAPSAPALPVAPSAPAFPTTPISPNPIQHFFPPVNAVLPSLPTTYHDFHSHNIPQQPQDISQFFHPQVPLGSQQPQAEVPQNFFQQHLPEPTPSHFVTPHSGNGQQFIQQQLPSVEPPFFSQTVQPLEENNQHQLLTQQQQQQTDFDGQNVIQPGQTDLQFPLHLPQHQFNLNGDQASQEGYHYPDQQQSASVFKPSLTLEPPYYKRRSSNDEDYDESEEVGDDGSNKK